MKAAPSMVDGGGAQAVRQLQILHSFDDDFFRQLTTDLPIGVLVQLPDSEIAFSNPKALELLGLTLDQLLGKSSLDPDWNVIHPDGRPFPGATHPVPQAIATRKSVNNVEMGVFRPSSQSRVWLLVNAQPQLRADGTVGHVVCTFSDVTQRNVAREAELAQAQRMAHVGSWHWLAATDANVVSPELCHIFGRETIPTFSEQSGTMYPPDVWKTLHAAVQQAIATGVGYDLELPALRGDGSAIWINTRCSPVCDASGAVIGLQGTVQDITARKQVEADLRIAAAAFDTQDGMIITDANGLILRVNQAFTEISGYAAADLVGKSPRIFQSGRHGADFYAGMWAAIHGQGRWQGEIWDRRKNGEIYPKWLSISAIRDERGQVSNYISTHHDLTERKRAEERIAELAFFDALTHLPNRTLLRDRLNQAMAIGHRDKTYGAVLFIDLDHFKTLNDTLGHDKGDLLLQQVAMRLTGCVREGDTVARLGGDEFVVILKNLNPGPLDAASQTEAVGKKILLSLNQPYALEGTDHRSTASVGATLFFGHESTVDELLKQADLAMYRSKDLGRNHLQFFDPRMQTVVLAKASLEADLYAALQNDQFLLYYQPQVTHEGRLVGAEVLLRWQHPTRAMVSPGDFIPVAEESGLILPLGAWVLHTACRQLAQWAARGEMAELTVAVNVSVHQFREPDFVAKVLEVLNQTGAPPQRLKLELTESLLVDNVQDVIEKMHALKVRGVGFSLDDFGTGYSSLAYLKRLPLDQLKIDQSFVCEVMTDPNDAVIAKTVVALGRSLGLSVIAEGVETQAQRDFLESAGCLAYQGYFFGRPMPVAQFEAAALLSRQRARSPSYDWAI